MNDQNYWNEIFNQATTNGYPLQVSIIREYFGNEAVKFFSTWFVNRRKQISY